MLLMGRNGGNVDTIMFANVDSEKEKVTLVSIPRDLYVDGRKINGYYGGFGLAEQVRQIEEVIGYKVHRYVLVDMMVFKDVVDLLGGVDIVLTEDLIDPTYKTCDGSVCGTLYYKAGAHHLNGTEALRVARSRHSSSDYSRADRQQLILQGVAEKVQSLGVANIAKLNSLFKTLLASTETNLSLEESLRYFFRYKDYELDRGNVLSTANILETVTIPVNYESSLKINVCEDEAKPETCKDSYAIYTLSPRNNNWNLIHWYIEGLLNE